VGSAEGATAPETLRQKNRWHAFFSEELLAIFRLPAHRRSKRCALPNRGCTSWISQVQNRGGAFVTRLAWQMLQSL